MKRTRHSPEQIATKFRDADAMLSVRKSVAKYYNSALVTRTGRNEVRRVKWGGVGGGDY